MAYRKRGEGSDVGFVTFNGFAITYRAREPRGSSPTFYKDADRGPQVYLVRARAIITCEQLAKEFQNGIWEVIHVQLREVPANPNVTELTSPD